VLGPGGMAVEAWLLLLKTEVFHSLGCLKNPSDDLIGVRGQRTFLIFLHELGQRQGRLLCHPLLWQQGGTVMGKPKAASRNGRCVSGAERWGTRRGVGCLQTPPQQVFLAEWALTYSEEPFWESGTEGDRLTGIKKDEVVNKGEKKKNLSKASFLEKKEEL